MSDWIEVSEDELINLQAIEFAKRLPDHAVGVQMVSGKKHKITGAAADTVWKKFGGKHPLTNEAAHAKRH